MIVLLGRWGSPKHQYHTSCNGSGMDMLCICFKIISTWLIRYSGRDADIVTHHCSYGNNGIILPAFGHGFGHYWQLKAPWYPHNLLCTRQAMKSGEQQLTPRVNRAFCGNIAASRFSVLHQHSPCHHHVCQRTPKPLLTKAWSPGH